MKFSTILAAAVISSSALVLGTDQADASSYPNFVFDSAGSSIEFKNISDFCVGGCVASADFDNGSGYVFSPTAVHETDTVTNMISWSVDTEKWWAFGGQVFQVEATLKFSEPDEASGAATGGGGFGTIFGEATIGGIKWYNDGIGEIAFAQGSVLQFDLEDVFGFGIGSSTTSGVTFKAVSLEPVPLPAAGWLLIAGLGGLAAVGRRKRWA